MQMVTIKAKPRMIFGVILALTGLIVLLLTFISNHGVKPVDGVPAVSGATQQEREAYLSSLGWEFEEETQKEITIPAQFNEVYTNYNKIQQEQGFDLAPYKGKKAVLYTYQITNYRENKNVVADLLVLDGKIVGADLCDPDAENGFLIGLTGNDGTA